MNATHHTPRSRKANSACPRKARRFVPGLDYALEARTSTTSLFYLQPGVSGIGTPLSATAINTIGTGGQWWTTGQADGVTSTDTGAQQLTDVGPNRFTNGFEYTEASDVTANVAAPPSSSSGTSSITIAVTHECSTVATNDNTFASAAAGGTSTSTTWSGTFDNNTPPGAIVAPMLFNVSSNSSTSTVTATFNASITAPTNNTYGEAAAMFLTSPFMNVWINMTNGVQGGAGLNVYDSSGTLIYADSGFGNDDAADTASNVQDHTALGATTLSFGVPYYSRFNTVLTPPAAVAPGGSFGGYGGFSWTFQITASD